MSWLKLLISLDLNIVGNIWDNVSTQFNKIYNIVLVVFGYFSTKILHIVPLLQYSFLMLLLIALYSVTAPRLCILHILPSSDKFILSVLLKRKL